MGHHVFSDDECAFTPTASRGLAQTFFADVDRDWSTPDPTPHPSEADSGSTRIAPPTPEEIRYNDFLNEMHGPTTHHIHDFRMLQQEFP
jgi:hypothetical protein